jgi:hypothetical protein
MFSIGERVRVLSFEGCPEGTGVVVENCPLSHRYEVEIKRDDLKGTGSYKIWWFPLTHVSYLELQYDPKQAGDKEDDI